MRRETFHYRGRSGLSILATLVTLLFAVTASAQQTNPLANDPRAPRAGGLIFRAQCATCHGADAKGISSIDAPDLTLMWTQAGMSEERVFTRIREGVPGSIMPPHDFPDTQIWTLVSYLRSVAAAGATREFTGDATRGEQLFEDNCRECHRVRGSGGSLGQNLDRITGRRTQDALIHSIRDPSASIARGYKPIELRFESQETVRGLIKGEDAFSIQILDSNQRLRGFSKSSILSTNRDIESLMPSYSEAELSDAQLDDILSYLHQPR